MEPKDEIMDILQKITEYVFHW